MILIQIFLTMLGPPVPDPLPDLPVGVRIVGRTAVSTSTATFNIDLSDVVSPPTPPATPSPIVSSFMPRDGYSRHSLSQLWDKTSLTYS